MCKYANLKGLEVKTEQQVKVLVNVLSKKSNRNFAQHSDVVGKDGTNSSDFGIERIVTR